MGKKGHRAEVRTPEVPTQPINIYLELSSD